jgi:hypothetical protein
MLVIAILGSKVKKKAVGFLAPPTALIRWLLTVNPWAHASPSTACPSFRQQSVENWIQTVF